MAGILGTFSLGTLTPSGGDKPRIISQQGNVGAAVTVALVGIAIASALGTLATENGDVTRALTGQGAVFSLGTLTSSNPQGALTGIGMTSALGTLGVVKSGTAALTGIAAALSQGTLVAPDFGDTYIQSAQGNLTASRTVPLTGIEAASALGTLTASSESGNFAPLTGVAITSGQGTLSVGDRSFALTGIAAAFSTGVISSSPNDVVLPLVGQAITAQLGTLGADIPGNKTAALTGLAMQGRIGNLRFIFGTGESSRIVFVKAEPRTVGVGDENRTTLVRKS